MVSSGAWSPKSSWKPIKIVKSAAEAVDALVGITHYKTERPDQSSTSCGLICHQQLDQLDWVRLVLILIHQQMPKAAVPVATHLLVLQQQLHRQQQEIIEVMGVVGSQCLAVTPIDIGGELAALTFGMGLELVGKPALVFGVTDRPTGLLGSKRGSSCSSWVTISLTRLWQQLRRRSKTAWSVVLRSPGICRCRSGAIAQTTRGRCRSRVLWLLRDIRERN